MVRVSKHSHSETAFEKVLQSWGIADQRNIPRKSYEFADGLHRFLEANQDSLSTVGYPKVIHSSLTWCAKLISNTLQSIPPDKSIFHPQALLGFGEDRFIPILEWSAEERAILKAGEYERSQIVKRMIAFLQTNSSLRLPSNDRNGQLLPPENFFNLFQTENGECFLSFWMPLCLLAITHSQTLSDIKEMAEQIIHSELSDSNSKKVAQKILDRCVSSLERKRVTSSGKSTVELSLGLGWKDLTISIKDCERIEIKASNKIYVLHYSQLNLSDWRKGGMSPRAPWWDLLHLIGHGKIERDARYCDLDHKNRYQRIKTLNDCLMDVFQNDEAPIKVRDKKGGDYISKFATKLDRARFDQIVLNEVRRKKYESQIENLPGSDLRFQDEYQDDSD